MMLSLKKIEDRREKIATSSYRSCRACERALGQDSKAFRAMYLILKDFVCVMYLIQEDLV